jgi:hypothetical protein
MSIAFTFFWRFAATVLGDVALGGKPLMACNTGMALEWVAWWLPGNGREALLMQE